MRSKSKRYVAEHSVGKQRDEPEQRTGIVFSQKVSKNTLFAAVFSRHHCESWLSLSCTPSSHCLCDEPAQPSWCCWLNTTWTLTLLRLAWCLEAILCENNT